MANRVECPFQDDRAAGGETDGLAGEWASFRRHPELGGVEALHARYAKHAFPRHFHGTYTVTLVEAGAMGIECRRARYAVTPGEVDVTDPGEVHTGRAATDEGWTFRSLYVPPELLGRAAAESRPGARRGLVHFATSPIRDARLARLLLRTHQLLGRNATALEVNSSLLAALARLVAGHGVPLVPGDERVAVRRVRDYLDAHYAEDVSLDALARLADLHPVYLVRAFRQRVGLPPHAYQRQLRVERARCLLAGGEGIAEAALAVGFADQSHLTRHFGRTVGATPGRYRAGS